jgi:hypothetical protein
MSGGFVVPQMSGRRAPESLSEIIPRGDVYQARPPVLQLRSAALQEKG